MRPWRAGSGARLAHPRIEPEVADQLARARKAADVADPATKVAATITLTPGTLSSRLTSAERRCARRVSPIEHRDLERQDVDLAQAAVGGDPLLGGQRLLGQPAPTDPPEQVGHRRARAQRARQGGVHLVLGAGAGPYQRLRRRESRRRRAARSGSGAQTASSTPGLEQLRQRAGVEAVGLRACLGGCRCLRGETTITRADVGLEDARISQALPVTSSAT